MKRLFICIFICAILIPTLCFGVAEASEVEGYKALYTVEAKTGYVIDGKEIDKRLPIASMVKIMTALIGFESVKSGRLNLSQDVVISDTAAGMGGSQMFLEEGDTYNC